MKSDFLFLYGTLMGRYPANSFLPTIQNFAVFIGECTLQGSLYLIDDYPGYIMEGECRIQGELWKMTEAVRLLEVLDPYEGFDDQNPSYGEYRREIKIVQSKDLGDVEAWVYIYQGPIQPAKIIASGCFYP